MELFVNVFRGKGGGESELQYDNRDPEERELCPQIKHGNPHRNAKLRLCSKRLKDSRRENKRSAMANDMEDAYTTGVQFKLLMNRFGQYGVSLEFTQWISPAHLEGTVCSLETT